MSLPSYPRYKESGVEWLGDVPERWNRTRLKHVARPGKKTFIDGDWIEAPYITTEGVRLLQCGNIGTGVFEEQGFRYVSEETFRSFGCTEVEPKDVLICRLQSSRTILAGRACLAPTLGVKMITSVDNCIVKPSSDFDPRYIVYQLSTSAYLSFIEVVARGGTRDRISRSMLADIELVNPPIGEQKAIADFLDREIAKIDALVEEQRRLIELLKEKRQGVISRAVTKGLNPDAPMKASGIEWLGKVPEHWKVLPAKRVATTFVPQRNKPDLNMIGDGLPWITMEQMKEEEIADSSLWVSSEAARKAGTRGLSPGAVVASCVGNFGAASVNTKEIVINQQLQAFIPGEQISPQFLRLCVSCAKSYFEQIGTAATLTYVNQQGFENMPLGLPPMQEQEQIVAFLNRSNLEIDVLADDVTRVIDLLLERRTALISAAVTGKIDVRGLVEEPVA